MKLQEKLLLISAIVPLIFISTISFLNLKEKVKLRFLIWESPTINLGSAIGISGLLGYSSSILLINFLLIDNNRKSTHNINQKKDRIDNNLFNDKIHDPIPSQYIERDPRDPTPTITIPYRIIQKKEKNMPYVNNEMDEYVDYLNDKININKNNSYKSQQSNNLHSDNDDWNDNDIENW
tara:strand:- start:57 stop:593 length:537 start_codon:yes stop_codon:yes gene_type:complete